MARLFTTTIIVCLAFMARTAAGVKSCFSFPVGTAGPNNDIEYKAMDVSSTSIVVGGYCKDTTLCGPSGTNPIIELFNSASHQKTWSKYVKATATLDPNNIAALRFSPDASKIMAGT